MLHYIYLLVFFWHMPKGDDRGDSAEVVEQIKKKLRKSNANWLTQTTHEKEQYLQEKSFSSAIQTLSSHFRSINWTMEETYKKSKIIYKNNR